MLDDDRADRLGRRRSSARRGRCGRPAGAVASIGFARRVEPAERRAARARSQARPTTASGRRRSSGRRGAVRARTSVRPSLAPRTTPRPKPNRSTSPSRTIRDWRTGIGDVVELGAELDERLEVGPALAELALVHRREGRRREGEQPERRDVEDGHPVELDRRARAGRRPAGRAGRPGRRGRRTAGASARARPSGRSGTRQSSETATRWRKTRNRSGLCVPPVAYIAKARYDAVDQEHQARGPCSRGGRAPRRSPPRRAPRGVGDHARDDRLPAARRAPPGGRRPRRRRRRRCQAAAREEQGHPLARARRTRLAIVGTVITEHASSSARRRGVSRPSVSGATRSFGSRPSRRDWISRNSRTASIRTSGKPNVCRDRRRGRRLDRGPDPGGDVRE